MNKIAWIDTETTGLDAVKQDVIQIAILIELDGVVVEEAEFKCQPYDYSTVQKGALDVHGYSVEGLQTFPIPSETLGKVTALLRKYITEGSMDGFIFAGYNSPFDVRFVSAWMQKGGMEFAQYFRSQHDVLPHFKKYILDSRQYSKNHKLVTAAEHFGITFDAHDALEDIKTTKLVWEKIKGWYIVPSMEVSI